MSSLIVVHPSFESHWPFVADHFFHRWRGEDETHLLRLERDDARALGDLVLHNAVAQSITRLVCLGMSVTVESLQRFDALREAAFATAYGRAALDPACAAYLQEREVRVYAHSSEGFWGESVAEYALALTLCGLRRIPQLYREMITDHEAWLRYGADRNRGPGTLGAQFSDDMRFSNGTVQGKRVRIVGAGNIGSRYASFVQMLGADVAAWDPFATEAHFHRAGSRREHHLERLLTDAEIFAPMLPLTESTRGLITAGHIDSLPRGCLVILATRAHICDMAAVRRRVLADEIALAADVFDVEPLPLDDSLLGRHNVVHTPHIAGRTRDANHQWVADLAAQFRPMAAVRAERE